MDKVSVFFRGVLALLMAFDAAAFQAVVPDFYTPPLADGEVARDLSVTPAPPWEGWKIASNAPGSRHQVLRMGGLVTYQPVKAGGKAMRGVEWLADAKANLVCTNLEGGRFLLENQEMIPVELRGKLLLLGNTEVFDPGDYRFVCCLLWDGVRWELGCGWLDDDFGERYVVVGFAS